MKKQGYYKYKLWCWTYFTGGDYREWNRTIYRKNPLTDKQKENLSGNFADRICWRIGKNIMLWGCKEEGIVE